ncbi:N-acetyltransferase, partial [Pseudomonas sp. BGM005]|nr:N-acetyltransferase [Pseudomonas sp. BG5]
MTDITVTRDDDASRYEIRSDGTLAGFAEFDPRPGA